MMVHPVYLNGTWKPARCSTTFHAYHPQTRVPLPDAYPVSTWDDGDEALTAAVVAARQLENIPSAQIAAFLEDYATRIEERASDLVEMAHAETGLPKSPRLADVELPRTTGQLRQAAQAARDGSWSLPCIDRSAGIRSYLGPLGPICVFGPNNFPFAFGSVSGGDFAAAIAAGNPVIGKANSSHPGTTRLFAEAVFESVQACGMPPATVQLLYRLDHTDGERVVSDIRVGATGYTGSRHAGLQLKQAADRVGKPIYLELSSINPVVVLSGALRERAEALVTEFSGSCLMGAGQFCTNPGLVLVEASEPGQAFVSQLSDAIGRQPAGTLLSASVEKNLRDSIRQLISHCAELLVGGPEAPSGNAGYSVANTVLRATGSQFLRNPAGFQCEAFGNATLIVMFDDAQQGSALIESLEGNLTGSIYSASDGSDDATYDQIAPLLRRKVGRLLNDKMPTGVAVSPAMNHGGPFPATGHPGFTAVGIPASLRRFAMLQCFDNVRPSRLPKILQD